MALASLSKADNFAEDHVDAERRLKQEDDIHKEFDVQAEVGAEGHFEKECLSVQECGASSGIVDLEVLMEMQKDTQGYRGVLWEVQVEAEEETGSLRYFSTCLASSQGQKKYQKLLEFDQM